LQSNYFFLDKLKTPTLDQSGSRRCVKGRLANDEALFEEEVRPHSERQEWFPSYIDVCNTTAKTTPKGWTPLHCAANAGNLKACEMILQHKSNGVKLTTDDGMTALHFLARLLIANGDTIDLTTFLNRLTSSG